MNDLEFWLFIFILIILCFILLHNLEINLRLDEIEEKLEEEGK